MIEKYKIIKFRKSGTKKAVKMGSIDENPNDKLRNRVEQGYFDFMANIILGFEPKWKEVK